MADTDGFMEFKNSRIENNIAITTIFGEILDSVRLTKIHSSSFKSNKLVSKEYIESENQKCINLCHIPKDYLEFYIDYAQNFDEINDVYFKIMKGFLQIEAKSSFDKLSNFINSFTSTIDIVDSQISNI